MFVPPDTSKGEGYCPTVRLLDTLHSTWLIHPNLKVFDQTDALEFGGGGRAGGRKGWLLGFSTE